MDTDTFRLQRQSRAHERYQQNRRQRHRCCWCVAIVLAVLSMTVMSALMWAILSPHSPWLQNQLHNNRPAHHAEYNHAENKHDLHVAHYGGQEVLVEAYQGASVAARAATTSMDLAPAATEQPAPSITGVAGRIVAEFKALESSLDSNGVPPLATGSTDAPLPDSTVQSTPSKRNLEAREPGFMMVKHPQNITHLHIPPLPPQPKSSDYPSAEEIHSHQLGEKHGAAGHGGIIDKRGELLDDFLEDEGEDEVEEDDKTSSEDEDGLLKPARAAPSTTGLKPRWLTSDQQASLNGTLAIYQDRVEHTCELIEHMEASTRFNFTGVRDGSPLANARHCCGVRGPPAALSPGKSTLELLQLRSAACVRLVQCSEDEFAARVRKMHEVAAAAGAPPGLHQDVPGVHFPEEELESGPGKRSVVPPAEKPIDAWVHVPLGFNGKKTEAKAWGMLIRNVSGVRRPRPEQGLLFVDGQPVLIAETTAWAPWLTLPELIVMRTVLESAVVQDKYGTPTPLLKASALAAARHVELNARINSAKEQIVDGDARAEAFRQYKPLVTNKRSIETVPYGLLLALVQVAHERGSTYRVALWSNRVEQTELVIARYPKANPRALQLSDRASRG